MQFLCIWSIWKNVCRSRDRRLTCSEDLEALNSKLLSSSLYRNVRRLSSTYCGGRKLNLGLIRDMASTRVSDWRDQEGFLMSLLNFLTRFCLGYLILICIDRELLLARYIDLSINKSNNWLLGPSINFLTYLLIQISRSFLLFWLGSFYYWP